MLSILLLTLYFPFNTHSFFTNIYFFGTRNFFGIRNCKNMNNFHYYNNIVNNISFKTNNITDINLNNTLPNFKKLDDSWDDGEIPWDVDIILPSNPFR